MEMLIKKPIVTEKSLRIAEKGWFTFAVDLHARKEEVSREIERIYKVNVLDVRTVSMHGKMHRVGRKAIRVVRNNWKKAVVKLKSGQVIDAFSVPDETPQSKK